jgi:diadenosine tetraphosphatase ApaH/serine/threonine PP2A family protein phosphatase
MERLGEQGGVYVWTRFNSLFNWLPLAALIEGRILCMHGGNFPPTPKTRNIDLRMKMKYVGKKNPLWGNSFHSSGNVYMQLLHITLRVLTLRIWDRCFLLSAISQRAILSFDCSQSPRVILLCVELKLCRDCVMLSFVSLPLLNAIFFVRVMVASGIGRSITRVEQISELQRPLTMEEGGVILMDLLWSDPTTNDTVEGVQPSPRGPGLVTFGPDRVSDFCKVLLLFHTWDCALLKLNRSTSFNP